MATRFLSLGPLHLNEHDTTALTHIPSMRNTAFCLPKSKHEPRQQAAASGTVRQMWHCCALDLMKAAHRRQQRNGGGRRRLLAGEAKAILSRPNHNYHVIGQRDCGAVTWEAACLLLRRLQGQRQGSPLGI